MQFLVISEDFKDPSTLERREAVKVEHTALAIKLKEEGHGLFGAALTDADGKIVGSVYICDFPSREALDEYLKAEAYNRENIWEHVTVRECKVGPLFAKG